MIVPVLILILDTNVAGFTPAQELERLAKRFTLRVSETALLERWVQGVRLPGFNDTTRREMTNQSFPTASSVRRTMTAVATHASADAQRSPSA
jgi:hypothetical protein